MQMYLDSELISIKCDTDIDYRLCRLQIQMMLRVCSVAAHVCVLCRDQRCGDPVKVWCSSHHILHPATSCSYIQLLLLSYSSSCSHTAAAAPIHLHDMLSCSYIQLQLLSYSCSCSYTAPATLIQLQLLLYSFSCSHTAPAVLIQLQLISYTAMISCSFLLHSIHMHCCIL